MLQYIVIIVSLAPITNCIIAYDCGHERVNMSTISLLNIDQCNVMNAKIQHENEDIQLLQLSEAATIHVYQCKINILQSIFRCGMFSHLSLVPGGFSTFIADISKEDCLKIHQYGTFKLENGRIISDIKKNSSSRYSEVVAGSLDLAGNCEGIPYTYGSRSWEKVIVMHALELTIADYSSTVRLDSNNVILRNSVLCPYLKGQCTDPEFGMNFWDMIPNTSCEAINYDVLYQGIATKIQRISTNQGNSDSTLYAVQTGEVIFTLKIMKSVAVCQFSGFQTEHPRLVIVKKTTHDYWFKKKPINNNNLDFFIYTNSKFVHVERHMRDQIEALYTHLVKKRCEIERDVLQTQLTMAHYHPSEFALIRMKEPGYTAVPRGEIIYLIKCQPVEISVRKTDRCFLELPVTYDNKSYFMTPTTHLLQELGNEIPCSSLMSSGYLLHGEWYGLNPQIHRLKSPHVLKPSDKLEWKYEDPGDLIKSGIYPSESIDQLRRQIMFSSERHAITNVLTQTLVGQNIDEQRVDVTQLFSKEHMNQLATTLRTKLWSTFIQFGNISAGVLGIILLFRAIRWSIDIIVNIRIIKSIHGYSWWLLAALWNSLTTFVLHKQHQEREEVNLTSVITTLEDTPSQSNVIDASKNANEIATTSNLTLDALRANVTLYPSLRS